MNHYWKASLPLHPFCLSRLIALCILLCVSPLWASNFPTDPILRLNPEGHFSSIWRIDVDANAGYLVSGSLDKTVKIWRVADGALLRTLRPPQGPGDIGKIYAVAISPDGTEVAAGGFTGTQNWEEKHPIYVFDRATGQLKHRITGLPNVISHLAYSPNGQYLVACLTGDNGIRAYQTTTYREIARDVEYGNDSYMADFAADGRWVTSCTDGKIRTYSPNFALLETKKAPGGSRPCGVAFSPDGRLIAVGYVDTTNVDVLDSRTLSRVYSADTEKVNNGQIASVAWSPDGQTLMAGGQYSVGDFQPVCRWSERGRGPFNNDLRVVNQTIMTLKPLADGRLAVSGTDDIVLLDPSDEVIWSKKLNLADFSGQLHENGIRLSQLGDEIAFGYESWGKRPARFSLDERTLTADPQDFIGLTLPDEKERVGLRVTNWEDRYKPQLNDNSLPLDEFERSRSLAISPDGKRFVLGTEWSLYAFSSSGDLLWQQVVPDVAWAVNITGDGRYAVAGYADGTLRWHRMTDGLEVLAFFPHPEGKRWVLWTPQGYYQASAGGEDLIGWHVNRGDQEAADFFGASRFRDRFYRPDVIAQVLKTGDVKEALRLADEARGSKTIHRSIAESLPPSIKILSPAPGTTVDSKRVALLYHARSSTAPITRLEARVDSRPAKVISDTILPGSQGKNERAGQITVEIPPENVTIELIAFNKHGSSAPASFLASWTGGSDYYKPKLYVLAVGISNHPVKKARLKWAAQDAADVVEALEAQKGILYKEVYSLLLHDEKATRDEIRRGLNWLQRETNQRDVAILFLAGHGFRNEFGEYYFLPYDGRPDEAELSSLSGYDIRAFLQKISGKTAVFIDTCYSGGLHAGKRVTDSSPDIERFANELAESQSGVIVFASSTGKQLSQEDDKWRNGAFTEALLEGLSGKADYTKDSYLFVSEIETYLSDRVSQLTYKKQKPMTTKPKAIENYRLLRVSQ
jgi:WD40 repeat protein